MKKLNKESEENRCVGAIINRQRGITLISLVITIVVLIILAGVAINLTLGENGIFKKAQEAKKLQLIATAKEQIGLELLEAQIEAIDNNEELEQEQVEEIVAKYGVLQADGDTIVLNDSGYEVSLSDIYNTMANTETDGDTTIELAQLKALLSQTTVTEDKILKDYKAYKDGQLITGTMENYAGQTITATTITESGENALITIPQNGYYSTSSKISVPVSEINSNLKSEIIDDFSLKNGIYAYYGYSSNYDYTVFDVTNFDNVTINITNSNGLAYITSFFNVYIDDVKQTLSNNVSTIDLDVSGKSKLKIHVTYGSGTEGFVYYVGTVKRY